MIEKRFTETFTVFRQGWSTNLEGFKVSTEQEIGTFNGHLQQADEELSQYLGLHITDAFTLWCPPDTNVKLGDKVKRGGEHYGVRLIQDNGFVGRNTHLEIALEKVFTEDPEESS